MFRSVQKLSAAIQDSQWPNHSVFICGLGRVHDGVCRSIFLFFTFSVLSFTLDLSEQDFGLLNRSFKCFRMLRSFWFRRGRSFT